MNAEASYHSYRADKTDDESLVALMTIEERALYQSFKNAIGKPVSQNIMHDLFFPLLNDGDVRLSVIRKWATINGDMNPLWHDESYACKTKWQGVVAPPLFLLTINDGTAPCAFFTRELINPSPNPTLNRAKYPNYRGVMQIATDWEFYESLRPGDFIRSVSTPTEIYWKQGKRFRLLFLFGETNYYNQHERRVAWNRVGAVYMFK